MGPDRCFFGVKGRGMKGNVCRSRDGTHSGTACRRGPRQADPVRGHANTAYPVEVARDRRGKGRWKPRETQHCRGGAEGL